MAGWGAPGSPAQGGGLPLDALAFTYDSYGNPVKELGYGVYVSGAAWTPYGEISQVQLGTGPSAAALTYSYDRQTRNVTGISLSDGQPSPQVDDTAYAYNADQQVTKITDTQGAPGSAPETQCFGYDGLSRLAQAWTSSDACAVNPAASGNATVSGPEPYWQSWTFDAAGDITSRTDHAVAGSSAGDTTLSYSYGVAGHAHAASSVTSVNSATGDSSTTGYGYDADGNTTELGGQPLSWNPGGTLKSAGTTSYVYDADGNELARTTPSGTTLFLPGEQLTQASSGTVTGMRYYTFAGKIIAEGTGQDLYWTEESTQGTLTAAVNAFTQSDPVIRRTFTPYGTPAGGGEGTWPDNRTFLNDPYNSSTGLVDVGARKYDPATGLFVSVDPVLDTSSPQAMNGYTYGGGDPVNNADPSGEMYALSGGGAGGLHAVRFRAAAARQAYNRLASQVENRQLNQMWEVDPNPRLIVQHIRQWANPGYARTQVSEYAAAQHVRYRREQEQAAAQAVLARQSSCGGFFGCAVHWVTHTALPTVGHAFVTAGKWINHNSTWLGLAEVGLGVAGMIASGPLGIAIFATGMLLDAATTASSCAAVERTDCALGAASMVLGGEGFVLGRFADEFKAAADVASQGKFFSRVFKAPILRVAQKVTRAFSQTANGTSVITGGLSILPCNAGQGPGC